MPSGAEAKLGVLAEWLAAVRGLRENPVRQYLLALQRKRQRSLRTQTVTMSMLLGCLAFILLVPFAAALSMSPRSDFAIQANGTCIVGALALWWLYGLYFWINDALSLFSCDNTQSQSLPAEFTTCPLRDSAIVTGALSVLLPAVLWRIVVLILVCYVLVPWPVLAGREDFIDPGQWPAFSHYLGWAFPCGVISLCLSGALCALALTCMLLVASHRGLSAGIRTACAITLPLVQLGCMLWINANYWESLFWYLGYFPDSLPALGAVLVILVLAAPLALVLGALKNPRAKSALAPSIALLPILSGALATVVIAGLGFGGALDYPTLPPGILAGGFFVMVNPHCAPDPDCVLSEPKWSEVMPSEFFPPGSSYRTRDAKTLTSSKEYRRIYTIWRCTSAIHFLLLLIIAAISLESARLSVTHWRQAG
jgi:hypothetical protein